MKSKGKTIIQTMIAILLSGSMLAGAGWIASKNGKQLDLDIDFNKIPNNNKAPTEETTGVDNSIDSSTGTQYEDVSKFPTPDDASKDEVILGKDEVVTDDKVGKDEVGADTLSPEVTLSPETTAKPNETTKPVETTTPSDTTVAPVKDKTYLDMVNALNTALENYYKGECVLDANYQVKLSEVFAVTINGNSITSYAIGNLPATNSKVILAVGHNHADSLLISKNIQTADPKNWKGEAYNAYYNTINGNRFNDYTLAYVVEEANNKISYYKTAKANRVNNKYEYKANVITINGTKVDVANVTVVSDSKLSKNALVEEIKIAINGSTTELAQ